MSKGLSKVFPIIFRGPPMCLRTVAQGHWDLDFPSSQIAGIAVLEGQPLPRYGTQLTC